MLVSTPGYVTSRGATGVDAESLPPVSWTVKGGARSGMPVGSVIPATTSTAPAAASARASSASLDGRPASALTNAASSGPLRASNRSGESASASGIRMSRAIAAGRSRRIASTSFAISVRGHGHWPIAARLFWSISTTVAGIDRGILGAALWYASNHADLSGDVTDGSSAIKGRERDQDGDADEADASGAASVRCGRRRDLHNSISIPSYAAVMASGSPVRVISSSRRVSASTASIAWSLLAGS
jgi:hypothetical protein